MKRRDFFKRFGVGVSVPVAMAVASQFKTDHIDVDAKLAAHGPPYLLSADKRFVLGVASQDALKGDLIYVQTYGPCMMTIAASADRPMRIASLRPPSLGLPDGLIAIDRKLKR